MKHGSGLLRKLAHGCGRTEAAEAVAAAMREELGAEFAAVVLVAPGRQGVEVAGMSPRETEGSVRAEAARIGQEAIAAGGVVKARWKRSKVVESHPVKDERGVFGAVVLGPGGGRKGAGFAGLLEIGTAVMSAARCGEVLKAFEEVDWARHLELQLDTYLDEMLDSIVGDLGFDLATISLYSESRREIRTVRSRNVPPAMRAMSRYVVPDGEAGARVAGKGALDILVDVLLSGKEEVIDGWDKRGRFNEAIYWKFGHELLTRVWMPIWGMGKVIGVIEAGGATIQKQKFLTEESLAGLRQIAAAGNQVEAFLPERSSLDCLASRIREALGAQKLVVTAWRGEDCIVDAWSADEPLDSRAEFPRQREILQSQPNWDQGQEIGLEQGRAWTYRYRAEAAVRVLITAYLESGKSVGEPALELCKRYLARMKALVNGDVTRVTLRDSLERVHVLMKLQEAASGTPEDRKKEEDVVLEIATRARTLLNADVVSLYVLDSDRSTGGEGHLAATEGSLKAAELLRSGCYPQGIVSTYLADRPFRYLSDIHKRPDGVAEGATLTGKRDSGDPERFAKREQIASLAMLKLRTKTGETLGVLFLSYREKRDFDQLFRDEAQALAGAAAASIALHRYGMYLRWQIDRSSAELDALRKLDEHVADSLERPDAEEICRSAVEGLAGILKCDVGAVVRKVRQQKGVEFVHCHGFERPEGARALRGGVVDGVMATGKARLIHDTGDETDYLKAELPDGMRSELAVPVWFEGTTRMAINLEDRRVGHFTMEDLRLAQLFAGRLSFAFRIKQMHVQIREQAEPRIALGMIAARVHDGKHDLAPTLRLLLTGVTAHEGLGFSRALLLLLDEEERLKGTMAIGKLRSKEAHETWERMVPDVTRPFEERLKARIAEAEAYGQEVATGRREDGDLSAWLQEQEWSKSELEGAAKWCLQQSEASTQLVEDARTDWFGRQLNEAGDRAEVPFSMWMVPLVTSGKPLGLLVVDERFKEQGEDLQQPVEKLKTLEAFAELAALSIENVRLRERIRTGTYIMLSHQVRNPLTVAMRYLDRAQEKCEPGRADIRHAEAEIERALWVANNVKLFADLATHKDFKGALAAGTTRDLTELVHRLADTWGAIRPTKRMRVEPKFETLAETEFSWHPRLFEQALGCLLDNATRYTTGEEIMVELRSTPEVEVMIRNESPEVDQQELDRILQWNVRGKNWRGVVSEGWGIGLPLAREAMRAVGGDVQIGYADGQFWARMSLQAKQVAQKEGARE